MKTNQKLHSEILQAIHGEYSAIACYRKLERLASSKEEKSRIAEIRQDEERHFQQFTTLYTRLTGQRPKPQITESCPDHYRTGLEFALQDEQKTVDFYHEIADRTEDRLVRKLFRRAAKDEQNHAVWFLYFFVKQK